MDVLGIVLTVLLLAANFFFVGAEFALISARRSIIEPLAREGSRRAKMTLWAIENVSLMMAGAQLGITVCSLALGYVTKPMVKYAVAGPFEAWGMSDLWIDVLSYAIALALVTYLHVVLGEMVPKNIALSGPEKTAMAMGPALVVVVKFLRPLLWIMNACGNGILRLFKVTPQDEVTSAFTRDEVADLVAESREGGLLDGQDERLLMGALAFESRTIGSVAIPLAQVQTLPSGATPAEVEAAAANGFSRFPLVAPDGVWLGYVHVKDVIGADAERRERPLSADMVRELPRFQADKAVRPALSRMQREGAHLALAVDAAGEPVGVVTLEDVLEELVGQVRDDSRSAS
ncbi:hemolysin family protein [Galactobacter caseinivorans]|uniref:HlyC/CorC family transporter n=1 Tax=Galactobacter caseinivorans TaxID=2676123 RepID=A0A496PIW3_9MICC|nr:hemolysin family protein [Galactobacter caseinivorans]RKW70436.1 HlyC/CorC family transporter [Galactobacter caseinivorans]